MSDTARIDHIECLDITWPNLPACASHPGPNAVIVPCPKDERDYDDLSPEWTDD